MKVTYFKSAGLSFLIVFLFPVLFSCKPLIAQQAPEPKAGFMAGQAEQGMVSKEPGLLFYLSGVTFLKNGGVMRGDYVTDGIFLIHLLTYFQLERQE
jgi:hypothetical protein